MRLIRFLFGRGASKASRVRAQTPVPAWTLRDRKDSTQYDVIFATVRDYQIREIGLVSRELSARGLRTAFVDASPRPDARTPGLAQESGMDFVPIDRYVAGCARPRVLVVRSEGDVVMRGLVEHANKAGIATAAVAHPVINFTRYPAPYTAAAVVLCAGPFSAARMRRKEVRITGFPGFDALSTVPRRPAVPPRVLVNLSLPRGLAPKGVDIDGVRIHWMSEIRGACNALGVPFVVSRHPADSGSTYDWPVDDRSVYDILPEVAAVVSPPSTVLMEAMAMGIPGVCHRDPSVAPFEMDTFDQPHGAFVNTRDGPALLQALRAEIARSDQRRGRFHAFLSAHVSFETNRSMTDRVADALELLVLSASGR